MSEVAPIAPTAFFNRRPLFRLQSGSLTLTDADQVANNVFNTNLGAIDVSRAMFIHRVQIQMNIQTLPAADMSNLYVYNLSENTAETSALTAGGDTRSLLFGEKDYHLEVQTSGMGTIVDNDAIRTINLDPWPIITIAQELNWLTQGVEVVAVASPDLVSRINIWYTLEPINSAVRSQLIARLNLAL